MMMSIRSKIRLLWLILVGLILLFLSYQLVAPTGTWTCQKSFQSDRIWPFRLIDIGSTCLGEASPGERVARGSGEPLLILSDPVYFSVFSPRAFSRAQVDIVYRPHFSAATPIFEAGFLADKKLWRYRLQPVYNFYLEQGFLDWTQLTEHDLSLWQRSDQFSSVSNFLDAWQGQDQEFCFTADCLAVYNVDLAGFPSALDINTLNQQVTKTTFPYALRGAHQFYVFLPNGDLDLAGAITDLNENKDKDEAEILLFQGREQVVSKKFSDDRPQKEESADIGEAQDFRIVNSNLRPGLYRLEFKANDDLILSNLQINSPYLSVINKIWPISNGVIELITDASYLQVKALSPVALQDLDFGEKSLVISEIYHQYEIQSNLADKQMIKLAKGGVIIANSGVFTTKEDTLINPEYSRLDRFASLSDKLEFILTDYQPAEILADDWLKASLDFTTADLYREDSRYNLILSIPGLQTGNGAGGLLEIKEIKIKFYGKSLPDKLKDWFNL